MFTLPGIDHFFRSILPNSLNQLDIYRDQNVSRSVAGYQRDNFVSDLADFMGGYKTAFKGSGYEYSDTVEYQYGDDIRHIDWNQSAKYGDLWVKQYQEERGREVLFLVDVSSSMIPPLYEIGYQRFFGVLALLGFAAIEMKDRIGLITFSDKVISLSKPSGDRSKVGHVLGEILSDLRQSALSGTHCSSIVDGLEAAKRVLKGRSIIFIVSDFISVDGIDRVGELAPAHQIVFVRLKSDVDPVKLQRLGGIIEARDAENHESIIVDLSDDKTRLGIRDFIDEQASRYQRVMMGNNINEVLIEGELDPRESVSSFFRKFADIGRSSS